MTNDPYLDREVGRRRVRVVTAWVAGAAVVGTGATALALASSDQAAAQQATTPVQQQNSDDGATDDDGGSVAPTAPQDGVQLPAAPPARSFGGGSGHASSGGS